MTLKEFASLLDGREYGCEITPEEEKLAKELGFVVVFGYSDDTAELRGAINDEIGCYDGDILERDDLPDTIYANWRPEDIDCAWCYDTSIPHEKFYIYDHGELYCVGIVCDINKPKQTNADRIRAMSDEELAAFMFSMVDCVSCQNKLMNNGKLVFGADRKTCTDKDYYAMCNGDGRKCESVCLEWLQQPVEEDNHGKEKT